MGQGACPGHLGHITLPLPTYNPFFFSVLYQVNISLYNAYQISFKNNLIYKYVPYMILSLLL